MRRVQTVGPSAQRRAIFSLLRRAPGFLASNRANPGAQPGFLQVFASTWKEKILEQIAPGFRTWSKSRQVARCALRLDIKETQHKAHRAH